MTAPPLPVRAAPPLPTVLVEAACCAAMAATPTFVYGTFFAGSAYLLPLLLTAVGGTLAAVLIAVRGSRPAVTAAVIVVGGLAAVAYGGYGSTLEFAAVPGWHTVTAVGSGLSRGWRTMLTVALPADNQGDLLATPIILTWFSAVASVLLALRTRVPLAAVGPPVAALAAALLLTASRPVSHPALTAVLLAVALVHVLIRAAGETEQAPGSPPGDAAESVAVAQAPDHPDEDAGTAARTARALRGRFAIGLPVAGVVLAVAVAAVHAMSPGGGRFDPRTLDPAVLRIDDAITPLATVGSQLQENPPVTLFTVALGGPAGGTDRLGVAALDTFDGSVWTSSDKFLVAGHDLTPDPSEQATRAQTAHIVVDGLPGPFLPAVGSPTSLEMPAADVTTTGYDAGSGMIATTASSLHGLTYDTRGLVRPPDGDLRLAGPSAEPAFAADAVLPPGLSPQVANLALTLTATKSDAYDKLLALQTFLRDLPYSLDAPPGHSYAAVARLLTGTRPGDDEGYAEQHAAAFAVLARSLDLPTRVVVGYLLRDGHDGRFTVTTRDADAWDEVHFTGYGWVVFDPTDPSKTGSAPPTQPNPGPVSVNTQPPQTQPAPAIAPPAPGPHGKPANGWGLVLRGTAIAAVALGGLVVVAVTAVLGEKGRRRLRRRRRRKPPSRVLGAWAEAVERLTEQGMRIPVSLSTHEVAERAQAVFDERAAALTELAGLAERAIFVPEETSGDDADEAWRLEGILRRALPGGRANRLRARLDPRALRVEGRDRRRARGFAAALRTGRAA